MVDDRDAALARVAVSLLAGSPRDLDAGAAAAAAHQLGGLYAEGLASLGLSRTALAPIAQEALRAALRREAAGDVLCQRETAALLGALAAAGLRPALLKGRALAVAVWPRPSLRPPGDLDLLLDGAGVANAAALLQARGYRAAPSEPEFRLRRPDTGVLLLPPPGGRVAVDLHARLFRSVGHRIDPAPVLARARPSLCEGQPVRALEPADQLHFVAVHAAKHGVHQLKWLLDLYALALRTDAATWGTVAHRARAAGTERPLHAAARLLAGLPGAALPDRLVAPRSGPWRPIIERLITIERAVAGRPPGRLEGYALEILLEPSLRARAAMAAGVVERWACRVTRSVIPSSTT